MDEEMSAVSPKVALVAGGSRGIGAATSQLLASRGMRVVVNYRSNDADATAVVGRSAPRAVRPSRSRPTSACRTKSTG
jgi:NAD(P)-dependent dehydrogenase (short-subunit alcohol dehydrogenase family)